MRKLSINNHARLAKPKVYFYTCANRQIYLKGRGEPTTYQNFHYLAISSFKRIKILELLIFLVDNCQAPMCFFVDRDKYLKLITMIRNIVSIPKNVKVTTVNTHTHKNYFVTFSETVSQLPLSSPSSNWFEIVATSPTYQLRSHIKNGIK